MKHYENEQFKIFTITLEPIQVMPNTGGFVISITPTHMGVLGKGVSFVIQAEYAEDGVLVRSFIMKEAYASVEACKSEELLNAYDDLATFKELYSHEGKFNPDGLIYSLMGLSEQEREVCPVRTRMLTYTSSNLISFKGLTTLSGLDTALSMFIESHLTKIAKAKEKDENNQSH